VTVPANNLAPPPGADQAPSGTGPGVLDRDIPPPGCEEELRPRAPEDIAAAIQADIADTHARIEALLHGLEQRVGLALYEQLRARLAATPGEGTT
jgi:hypothetical protein